MTRDMTATWHKASYDEFLQNRLPDLLAQRLPVVSYAAEATGTRAVRITLAVGRGAAPVTVTFEGIPGPDESGVFELDGRRIVVVPIASRQELDQAEVRCVGEQMYEVVAAALGEAPAELEWTQALVQSWVPLDRWLKDFLRQSEEHAVRERQRLWPLMNRAEIVPQDAHLSTVQLLDDQNWLSRLEHTRRIVIAERKDFFAAGQLGRACPVMTPEGANIGRVLALAAGAAIRDGRVVIEDDSPAAALSVTASCIPFIEHTDCNRALMGANMVRQWVVPAEPEPALVQTGNEPAERGFWCGRNLLTAFVSWGRDTYEDGLLLSESAAARLGFPHALEPGDKLSNRHGTKGVVSRIVPDDEMPHLADGTPVELVFSFIGCQSRLNHGQLWESLAGRIAKAEGAPLIVPPFAGPDEAELRRRLAAAGWPESGMDTLTMGKDGPAFKRPSTVGYVYWGKPFHLAAEKLHVCASAEVPGQFLGESEYFLLRDAGAATNIAEAFNLRSQDRPDAATLPERLGVGDVELPGAPTPAFAELQRRLGLAGIRAELDGGRLRFALTEPANALKLARPVPHPWLPGRELSALGRTEDLPEFTAVIEANDRLARLGSAPASLVARQTAQLAAAVGTLLDALLTPDGLHLEARGMFSGRSVIAPGVGLRWDQVGLPEEMAWGLFGPLAARGVGAAAVEERSDAASAALDEAMSRRRVLVNRAPTVLPTSIMALRPTRVPGRAIRFHPMHCTPTNGDFDGDQVTVHLPVSAAAQHEASELLSPAAQLRRHPEALDWFTPKQSALWGLAELSRSAEGLAEVRRLAGVDVAAPEGFITRQSLLEAMNVLLARDGAEKTLATCERLLDRGFEVAKASGASLNPFCPRMDLPAVPDDPQNHAAWEAYEEEVTERLASRTDYDADDLGPQLLAVKCGARGNLLQLRRLVGGERIAGVDYRLIAQPRSLCEGPTPQEYYDRCIGARRGLGRFGVDMTRQAYGVRESSRSGGFAVLARAMRSRRPGLVFAHAAAIGEIDPLTDLDSRLFVGLT